MCVFNQNDSITMAVAHQAKYRSNNLIAKIKRERERKIDMEKPKIVLSENRMSKKFKGNSCINQVYIFIQ